MVNASIPGVSLIRDPSCIRLKGMAVAIEGGEVARRFRDLLASFNDPLVYNLGELGVA